ncbi:AMP-dependent synthetase and ligase [Alicyclobacillus hesperidum URH17-3-68]|uniref:hypothetical protein n=1 Tax=Alicyclobacillus hesperidum TaxID=89784 RepID=UPI000281AD64|nr:hypothetical protein [Alicyclobacillus hesperidum]EJY56761.1 AMP-dependent synthetase and ligase [Alicyclobacillus hesperidum URH17-3-68]
MDNLNTTYTYLNQCRQTVQQLMQQTQQASMQYQQMMQQELQNAQTLEQLAQRERQAAQMIQQALQGHQMVMQQLQHIQQMCDRLGAEVQSAYQRPLSTPAYGQTHTPNFSMFHQ